MWQVAGKHTMDDEWWRTPILILIPVPVWYHWTLDRLPLFPLHHHNGNYYYYSNGWFELHYTTLTVVQKHHARMLILIGWIGVVFVRLFQLSQLVKIVHELTSMSFMGGGEWWPRTGWEKYSKYGTGIIMILCFLPGTAKLIRKYNKLDKNSMSLS